MKKQPSYLWAVLNNKCPRCRQGDLFIYPAMRIKQATAMHSHCPVCNQATEIEIGFYYGTGYVSYGLTVAISVATFVAWCVLIGVSVSDNRLWYWLASNGLLLLLLQPYLMRLSRTLWLGWFVPYNRHWKADTQPSS